MGRYAHGETKGHNSTPEVPETHFFRYSQCDAQAGQGRLQRKGLRMQEGRRHSKKLGSVGKSQQRNLCNFSEIEVGQKKQ